MIVHTVIGQNGDLAIPRGKAPDLLRRSELLQLRAALWTLWWVWGRHLDLIAHVVAVPDGWKSFTQTSSRIDSYSAAEPRCQHGRRESRVSYSTNYYRGNPLEWTSPVPLSWPHTCPLKRVSMRSRKRSGTGKQPWDLTTARIGRCLLKSLVACRLVLPI